MSKATIDQTRRPANQAQSLFSPLRVGPYTLENVIVTVPGAGEKTSVRKEGILGYDVLRHFLITMDWDRQQMHIEVPPEAD